MRHTILVVDDNRSVREYCKQELEADGHRVLLAEDGEDAIDVLAHIVADLVVLDEHMPRCRGLEAAKHIQARNPHIPIVLFTADQDYDRYTSPFIRASIMKSENLGALREVISQLLSLSRTPASAGAQASSPAGCSAGGKVGGHDTCRVPAV